MLKGTFSSSAQTQGIPMFVKVVKTHLTFKIDSDKDKGTFSKEEIRILDFAGVSNFILDTSRIFARVEQIFCCCTA